MISADDIDAMMDPEAIAQAETFARRAEKGLPTDRWASDRQMVLVARGIRSMQRIMAAQSDLIVAMVRTMDADAKHLK